MKKGISIEKRAFLFRIRAEHRRRSRLRKGIRKVRKRNVLFWQSNNKWLLDKCAKNLLVCRANSKNRLTLILPEIMNFSTEYDKTSVAIEAIRRFSRTSRAPSSRQTLSYVDFSNLRKISTSAALVLTAELCKWEDATSRKLRSRLDEWDEQIAAQLNSLGFFDLFEIAKGPVDNCFPAEIGSRRLVRYIKAKCNDPDASIALGKRISELIGSHVDNWMFLHMGISEAITNVSHHAYPSGVSIRDKDKNWYLTGSYDSGSRKLKIAFYDQGVGIPNTLPASRLWERVADIVSRSGLGKGRKDAILISAAMEVARTSTDEGDRGKGLNDLVEFARKRKSGYLSIISNYGLCKIQVAGASVERKTRSFGNKLPGTLIIWSTTLDEPTL